MAKKKVLTAKLTEEENALWERSFENYMNQNVPDLSTKEFNKYIESKAYDILTLKADAYAAKVVCKKFPRLKKFDKFAV